MASQTPNPAPSAFVPSDLPADAVELGRVQGAWGVKGWVRIHAHSADSANLAHSQRWFLRPPEARFVRGFSAFHGVVQVRVLEAKPHSDGWVAQLDGVEDRGLAESLKGAGISVSRSDFVPLEAGEYYWVDLIGLEVHNRQGEHLGVVRELMATGPSNVLVLAYTETLDGVAHAAERLIPFVDAYIDSVDLLQKRIVADWQTDY